MLLTPEKTRLLIADLPRIWHVPVHDALIAALAQALGEWTDNGQQLIDIEGHGREEFNGEINLSRTVGWFTTICPVLIDTGTPSAAISRLVRIHEQLRDLPVRALAFGLLRYLANTDCRRIMSDLPQPEVIFNFMGQSRQSSAAGSLWRPAAESSGPSRSPRQPRSHLIELNAEIIDGALSAEFTYSTDCYLPATVASLGARFHSALEALAADCLSAPRAYRPSDFPEASLSQTELDQVLAGTRDCPGKRTMSKKGIEAIYALSPQQLGMLLESLHTTGSGMHVEQKIFKFDSSWNIPAWRESWQRVVDWHPALRTAFVWRNQKEPLQAVISHADIPFEQHDLRELDEPHARNASPQSCARIASSASRSPGPHSCAWRRSG